MLHPDTALLPKFYPPRPLCHKEKGKSFNPVYFLGHFLSAVALRLFCASAVPPVAARFSDEAPSQPGNVEMMGRGDRAFVQVKTHDP